jgi:hypothetical protein
MPKGYWFVRVDVKDEEPAKRYVAGNIQSSRNSADAIWSEAEEGRNCRLCTDSFIADRPERILARERGSDLVGSHPRTDVALPDRWRPRMTSEAVSNFQCGRRSAFRFCLIKL